METNVDCLRPQAIEWREERLQPARCLPAVNLTGSADIFNKV